MLTPFHAPISRTCAKRSSYESVSWTSQETTAANTIFLEEEGIQEAAASLAAANKISMGAAVEGILALALLISDLGESLKEQQARS